MSRRELTRIITDTSPASATTTVSANTATGLAEFDWFMIDATLTGGTGGTLNVYLQREIATNVWADWIHFPELAAGAAAVSYSVQPQASNLIATVGIGTTAAPGVALAAGGNVGGHPGDTIRAVYVAGTSTSAGATQVIRVSGWST